MVGAQRWQVGVGHREEFKERANAGWLCLFTPPSRQSHVPRGKCEETEFAKENTSICNLQPLPPRRLPSSTRFLLSPFFHTGAALPAVCSGSASRCCGLLRQSRRPKAWAPADAWASQHPLVFVLVAAQSSRNVAVLALQHDSRARGVHTQAYVRWACPTSLRLGSYASRQRAGGRERRRALQ